MHASQISTSMGRDTDPLATENNFFCPLLIGVLGEGTPMEDLGVRMMGSVQKHLFCNRAGCTALLIHLPPQQTVAFIQSCRRSLTVPQSRPTAFATVLLTAHHVILPKKSPLTLLFCYRISPVPRPGALLICTICSCW